MKKFLLIILACMLVSGCYKNLNKSSKEDRGSSQKVYLDGAEYESELEANAQKERRGAKPVIESNYVFKVIPRDTYFFDENNMPVDDGYRKPADYKAKRLWERPKRYKEGEYAAEGVEPQPASSADSEPADYEDWF